MKNVRPSEKTGRLGAPFLISVKAWTEEGDNLSAGSMGVWERGGVMGPSTVRLIQPGKQNKRRIEPGRPQTWQ